MTPQEKELASMISADKYIEQVANDKMARLEKIQKILSSGKLDYHPIDIQKFQGVVNFIAREFQLQKEVESISRVNPKTNTPYTCPMEFGDAVIDLFISRGVPSHEIARVNAAIEQIIKNINY